MASRKYILIFAGIIIVSIIVYLVLPRQNKEQQIVAKVKKGNFPIEVSITGELIAKSSEKIFGPQCLRQIGIWQVKMQG